MILIILNNYDSISVIRACGIFIKHSIKTNPQFYFKKLRYTLSPLNVPKLVRLPTPRGLWGCHFRHWFQLSCYVRWRKFGAAIPNILLHQSRFDSPLSATMFNLFFDFVDHTMLFQNEILMGFKEYRSRGIRS